MIGTFKKCFYFYVHIQDRHYLHQELRDSKTLMLAFFLEEKEYVRDLLKEGEGRKKLAKRLLILKYDLGMGVIVAYVPKEREKCNEIIQAVYKSKNSLLGQHERMFKKVKRNESKISTVDLSRELMRIVEDTEDGMNKQDDGTTLSFAKAFKTEKENVTVVCLTSNKKSTKTPDKQGNEEADKQMPDHYGPDSRKKEGKVEKVTEPDKSKPGSSGTGNPEAKPTGEKSKESGSGGGKGGRICWSCHAPEVEGVKLARCRGCKRARYCDQQCQAADWERHQGYCVERQTVRQKKEDQ